MKQGATWRLIFGLLCCVGLAIFLTGCLGGSTGTVQTYGTVIGSVFTADEDQELILDDNDEPIAFTRATVFIEAVGKATFTDDHGEFTMDQVPVGTHTLSVIMHGSDDRWEDQIEVTKDAITTVSEIPFRGKPIEDQYNYHYNTLYINDELLPLELRQAISLAINKAAIVPAADPYASETLHQYHQILAPHNLGYDDTIEHTYDPAAAEAILDAFEGTLEPLTLIVNDNTKRVFVTAMLKQQLEAVGFEVNVVVLDWEDFNHRYREWRDEIVYFGLRGVWNSARQLHSLLHSDASLSAVQVPEPALEQRIMDAFALYDEQEFVSAVQAIQSDAMDGFYMLQLFYFQRPVQ